MTIKISVHSEHHDPFKEEFSSFETAIRTLQQWEVEHYKLTLEDKRLNLDIKNK